MKTSVLVTGHTGFVGSALTAALARDGRYEVIGASRSQGCDLRDEHALSGMPEFQLVVHLAGAVGVLQSWAHPLETFRDNLLPTLNVLECARLRGTPVIYMSSYVYGTPQYLPIDEHHPVQCRNPYARSKRQAELLCEAYAADYQVPVAILRPFNIYGPNQTPDSLIPSVIRQARETGRVRVHDLEPKRDYVHVDDVVEAIVRILRAGLSGLEYYNLGCGTSYSVREVIDLVLGLLGGPCPVSSTGQTRPNEIGDCVSNSQKIAGRYGWRPRVTLAEGIAGLLNAPQGGAPGHDKHG